MPLRIQQLSLFLWTLVLIGLQPAAAVPKAFDRIIQGRDYHDRWDHVYQSVQSSVACDDAQIQVAKQSIKEAQSLAEAALRVLEVEGVETSQAFHTWFGASNASPQFVKKLRRQHYKTAFTHLRPPTIPAKVSIDKVMRYRALQEGSPDPGRNSLIYLCGRATSKICPKDSKAFSGTFSTDVRKSPTVLTLCHNFFYERRLTNAQMIDRYREDVTTPEHSNGFVLLHELQHMRKATSPDPPASDELDPNGKEPCYERDCCVNLPDKLKIWNAQNFAYFALDIIAHPESARPGSAGSSSSS